MPKSKEQLEVAGYSEFYWFGPKYRWMLIGLLSVLGAFAAFSYHWIVDTDFDANWQSIPHCDHRGCGYLLMAYALAFLFLSLPIWIKLPTALIAFLERIHYLARRLIWTLDRHPDLALGPTGVYFPRKLKYLELNWLTIKRAEIVRSRNSKTLRTYVSEIRLYGFGRTERTLRDVGPLTDPVLCSIPLLYGFDQPGIIAALREYAPALNISETVSDFG